MKTKAWAYGLATAIIAAAANAAMVLLGSFTFAPELLRNPQFWEAVGGAIVFAGLKTAFAYLAKSPLPGSAPKSETK